MVNGLLQVQIEPICGPSLQKYEILSPKTLKIVKTENFRYRNFKVKLYPVPPWNMSLYAAAEFPLQCLLALMREWLKTTIFLENYEI